MELRPPDDRPAVPFHTALYNLRQTYRLRQEDVARLAGISQRTVSNLERNTTRFPNPRTWRGLATAFGVSVEELQRQLLGRSLSQQKEQRPRVDDVLSTPSTWTPLAERVAALVDDLTPVQREYVLAVCLAFHALRYGEHDLQPFHSTLRRRRKPPRTQRSGPHAGH